MPDVFDDIALLLFKRIKGTLTPDDAERLRQWVNGSPMREQLLRDIEREGYVTDTLRQLLKGEERTTELLRAHDVPLNIYDTRVETHVPVYHIDRRTRGESWWKYAAAAIVVLSIGAYLWNTQQQEKSQNSSLAETTTSVPLKNDVAPGGNKAMLVLADGRKIILDSAPSGTIANEQGANIVKSGEGRIVYTRVDADRVATISYNTMSTPRGGQYQLTLPDGSRVWLNSESSITYPTVFEGKERRVTVNGEAYFEVAKDQSKPFIVSVKNNFDIEVLGTHFNVNAYADEKITSTTLLEGRVRLKTVHTSFVLKPGQQGQFDLSADRLSLAVPKDASQAAAWKDGVFNFHQVPLDAAMRQVARWYDVTIHYPNGKIPDIVFGGKMGRNLTLQQLLEGLQGMGATFQLDGKTLTIL